MQKIRKLGFLAALGASAMLATACRDSGDDDGNNTDDPTDSDGMTPDGGNGDGGGGGEVTVAEVQADSMAAGTPVTLKGVVVTAISKSASPQGVYVQDPAGGPFSGVFVYRPANIDDVQIGDVITVEGGVKDEFMYVPSNGGNPDTASFTEVAAPDGGEITLTKTGTGTVTPEVLDPATLAGSLAEAEKWESVLITFEDVAVISALNDFGEIRVDGPFIVQDSLTTLQLGGEPVALGDCFGEITGVVNYFYAYKLLPRSSADMVAGDGCGTSQTAATVAEVQAGEVPVGSVAELKDVVVTAVLPGNNLRVWVADAGQAASGQGVLVYRAAVPGGVPAIGDVVDASGIVTEFDGGDVGGGTLTQLQNGTITKTGETATVTPVVVPVATLAAEGTAEAYEGVLVTVQDVELATAPDAQGVWTVSSGADSVSVDDFLFAHTPTAGSCYASVTGIFDFSFDLFKILPRSAGDIVTEACP